MGANNFKGDNNMSVEIIGKQIASLRKEKGVKQEELAKYVGVSTQAVSKWENGGVPDVELIPKIADFFSVSIDNLFNRNISDDNLQSVLMKKIAEAPYDRKFKIAFNFCWDIERALMRHPEYIDKGSIENYEKEIGCSDQHYSSIIRNDGFTRMGIANRSQYFLIVPNPRSTNDAYFKGINYPAFFKDMSDKAFFDACVFLNQRDSKKAFTPMLLVKKLGIDVEKANEILKTLKKYHLVSTSQVEMDDELQTVYQFRPTPSLVALLIFAREIIDIPEIFAYNFQGRTEPYFKQD